MIEYKVNETNIDGLIVLENFIFKDKRGTLNKYFSDIDLSKIGLEFKVKEIIEIRPLVNSLRGLHIQTKKPQAKIVRVIQGSVFDVVVDLRPESNTYGKYFSIVLDYYKNHMLYIPKGFAHGFLSLEKETIFNYMCSENFNPEMDDGLIWNDEELNIDWPIDDFKRLIISEKDSNLSSFMEYNLAQKKGI
jgi:dTDP-4-dehydrorhamnose 3,5-epimerase